MTDYDIFDLGQPAAARRSYAAGGLDRLQDLWVAERGQGQRDRVPHLLWGTALR